MKKLVINKEDLVNNIEIIKKLDKSNKIIGVVKANGYGYDLIKFSNFLIENGIQILAVSTAEDAIKLRQSGIENQIILLSVINKREKIEELIENNITLTIGSESSSNIVNEIAKQQEKEILVHLKIDTGFGRYGFLYDDINTIVNTLKQCTNLRIEATFSHFSQSFAKSTKYTEFQFNLFENCIAELKKSEIDVGYLHICNSSAFLKFEKMHLEAVRIGSAFSGRIQNAHTYGLKRIGKVKIEIAEIKYIPKNFKIGYASGFTTKKETKIAIIPIGHYEGFNIESSEDLFRSIDRIRYLYNSLKNLFKKQKKIQITINNNKYDIVGRIGSYHMVADISNSNVEISDIAVLEVKPLYIDSNIEREYN